MPDEDLTTADAAATLAAEEEDERAVREVEVRRMRRMLHFCDLNSIDPPDPARGGAEVPRR